MTPPLYLALLATYINGAFEGAHLDTREEHRFTTFEACNLYIRQVAAHALADDGKSVAVACVPVPSTH